MRTLSSLLTLTLALIAPALPLAAEPAAPETLAIGAPAPDFNLPGVDGRNWKLADFADQKLLAVVFTCNHCPDAIAAQERFKKLVDDYRPKGVAFVAISGNDPLALQLWELGWSVYGDSFEEMAAHAKDNDYNFPYLYDGETQKVTMAYGAAATPHVFLFDAERRLRYQGRLDNGRRDPGPASENNAREVLDLLLADKDVPAAQQTSRVFGCSTKWSWKRELATGQADEWNKLPVAVAKADAALVKSLAANKTNKIRLLNVWSTSCGPCIAEFPDLVKIYQQYQQRDFDFITISTDPANKRAEVAAFLAAQHAALAPNTANTLRNEPGREAAATNNFHFTGDLDALADALDPAWQGPLPHTVLLAPGGEVLYRHTGQVDPIEIRRAIVQQLRRGNSE